MQKNLLLTVAILGVANPVLARNPEFPLAPDSLSLAVARAEPATEAARSASMRSAVWSSAGASFFPTPFVGGVGSVIASHLVSGTRSPSDASLQAADPAYQEAFHKAYRDTWLPRYRRAVRNSVLVTTVLCFARAVAFSG